MLAWVSWLDACCMACLKAVAASLCILAVGTKLLFLKRALNPLHGLLRCTSGGQCAGWHSAGPGKRHPTRFGTLHKGGPGTQESSSQPLRRRQQQPSCCSCCCCWPATQTGQAAQRLTGAWRCEDSCSGAPPAAGVPEQPAPGVSCSRLSLLAPAPHDGLPAPHTQALLRLLRPWQPPPASWRPLPPPAQLRLHLLHPL